MENIISKYLERLHDKIKGDKRFFLAFRGQSNESWILESSAARRIKANTNEKSLNRADFLKYHEVLVEKGLKHKKRNSKEGNDKLPELELLAEIQHLGGATCLTDFTTNFLISLWFASAKTIEKGEEIETNGKIYVININSIKNQRDIKVLKEDEETNLSISTLLSSALAEKNRESFYAWQPNRTKRRIHHQDSLFLFGLSKISEENYTEIIIEKEHKEHIRRELNHLFDINVENVFPDFQGFAFDANNPNAPFNDLYCKSCLEVALDFLEEHNKEEHEKYFERALDCKKQNNSKCERNSEICQIDNLSELYFLRGTHKMKNSTCSFDKLSSIDDFEKVIASKNDFVTDSLQWSIDILYDLGLNDNIYYNEAITKSEILIKEHNSKHYFDYCYFSILELALFVNDEKTFNRYFDIIKTNKQLKKDNGSFLLELFKQLAKIEFGNEKVDIERIIERVGKLEVCDFNDNFIWNFKDLTKWIEKKSNSDNSKNLFSTLEKTQNRWIKESNKMKEA